MNCSTFIHFFLILYVVKCLASWLCCVGEPLQQRDDDKPEIFTERLKNFQSRTKPLLNYYDKLQILKTFTGTESDEIWPEVKNYISELSNQ